MLLSAIKKNLTVDEFKETDFAKICNDNTMVICLKDKKLIIKKNNNWEYYDRKNYDRQYAINSVEDIIGFWKPDQNYGEFSQWYKSEFEDSADIKYSCAEQYMMAQKALMFGDTKVFDMIMSETNPANMKKYGRMISNFNEHIWNRNKENIVFLGNLLKFSQNKDLKKKLLETKNSILCEASPYDKIWGIGTNEYLDPRYWNGENLLGFILMKVRDRLK